LELEPMGAKMGSDKEVEEFVPIDDLDYAPDDGWEKEDPQEFHGVSDEEERKKAVKYIWRRYRVKLPTEELPEAIYELEELQQILPLIDHQVRTEKLAGESKPKDSIVWGKYWDGKELGKTTIESLSETDDYDEKLEFKGSFTVDTEHGYVDFSEFVIDIDDSDAQDIKIVPPKLYLRCTINIRDKDTREAQRFSWSVTVDNNRPTQPEYFPQEDVLMQFAKNTSNVWKNNKSSVEEKLQYYLQQKSDEYTARPGASASYPGFYMLNLDGAIRQRTFTIDASGLATTDMTRNMDRTRKALTWREMKRASDISSALDKRAKDARKQARDERIKRMGRSAL
jgi:hypothetical protein